MGGRFKHPNFTSGSFGVPSLGLGQEKSFLPRPHGRKRGKELLSCICSPRQGGTPTHRQSSCRQDAEGRQLLKPPLLWLLYQSPGGVLPPQVVSAPMGEAASTTDRTSHFSLSALISTAIVEPRKKSTHHCSTHRTIHVRTITEPLPQSAISKSPLHHHDLSFLTPQSVFPHLQNGARLVQTV